MNLFKYHYYFTTIKWPHLILTSNRVQFRETALSLTASKSESRFKISPAKFNRTKPKFWNFLKIFDCILCLNTFATQKHGKSAESRSIPRSKRRGLQASFTSEVSKAPTTFQRSEGAGLRRIRK